VIGAQAELCWRGLMMADKTYGSMCASKLGADWMDPGTMCRSQSRAPGVSGLTQTVMSLVLGATPNNDKACIPLKQILMIDNSKFEVVITSHFPMRIHPVSGQPQFHGATDLVARPKWQGASGQYAVPVQPWASGIVIKAASQHGGAGNYIVIDHGNGVQSWYMHMETSSAMLRNELISSPQIHPDTPNPFVKVGQHVRPGNVIGLVGSSGSSTGAHLHVELHLINRYSRHVKIDPEKIENLQAAVDVGDENLFNELTAFMNEFRQKIPLRQYRSSVSTTDLEAARQYRTKRIETSATSVEPEDE